METARVSIFLKLNNMKTKIKYFKDNDTYFAVFGKKLTLVMNTKHEGVSGGNVSSGNEITFSKLPTTYKSYVKKAVTQFKNYKV